MEKTSPSTNPHFTGISHVLPQREIVTFRISLDAMNLWTYGRHLMPRVPVSVARTRESLAESTGRQTTLIRNPGRPFFIVHGIAQTSRAPDAIIRSMQEASTSPVTSSTLVSSTSTLSSPASPPASRSVTLSTLGMPGESRSPAPYPVAITFPET
ncbi:MAG: hypothetical protein A4E42_00053 [Methanoregulaceae archaeon PtaU1.Bin222]|nr:MAG: hypothetical protein A4E42_00053 [Methanoregulaceae archaeon PtaU1.Bin222]